MVSFKFYPKGRQVGHLLPALVLPTLKSPYSENVSSPMRRAGRGGGAPISVPWRRILERNTVHCTPQASAVQVHSMGRGWKSPS